MEKSVRFSAVQSRLLWFFSLLRNLRGGLRIAFWLPVSRSAFRTTPTDYAVLAAFNVLVWIIGSGLRTGTEGGLNPSALPGMFTIIPVMLLVCLILSRLFRDASLLLAFAVMLGSTDLVFEVAGTAIFTVFETVWSDGPPLTQMSVYLLYVAWAVASVIRTQAILVPWGRRRSGIAALLLTAMVLGSFAVTAMLTKNAFLEEIRKQYVLTARAKGLMDKVVRRRHAVPNALLPTMTLIFLNLGFVVGGAITIEYVFSIPGLGSLTVDALSGPDVPLLQALFLLFSAAVIAANLVADLLYARLDPRVRT